MGRPKGSQNKIVKMETRKAYKKASEFPEEEALQIKDAAIDLLTDQRARDLTEAADLLGIPSTVLHLWYRDDEVFKSCVDATGQIIADEQIRILRSSKNVLAAMFLVKRHRPEYRDNNKQPEGENKVSLFIREMKAIRERYTPPLSACESEVTRTQEVVFDCSASPALSPVSNSDQV
ncbi:hypothetical protein [Dehalococcoides mccartyi]|uniref:hypothetical protein n=1 Tax=Dehalococcoides mccartyi TaxID=61435 RepID=UPI000805649B|nr:hypothetical protein [Dehalococcoides mccartyi]OBW62021.1 MAG: hypothetical protein A9181_03375 [Dehalococcoides mccartyi]